MSASSTRNQRRRARHQRAARVELGIGLATSVGLGAACAYGFITNGRVSDILLGSFVTVTLTALGRYADRRYELQDDADDEP